jgi:hypothetical protein
VLIGLRTQIGDVDVAHAVARNSDDLETGHDRAGGVGAVRGGCGCRR